MAEKKRLVVGITGASGTVLGIALLKALARVPEWESHLILSQGAVRTLNHETNLSPKDVTDLADYSYNPEMQDAPVASGSFETQGMVIIPCSMKTLAATAHGYAENLLLRAADVHLKEQRKLILVPRESPLNPVHLRNMTALADMGVLIMPPVLSFYHNPQTPHDIIDHITGKIMTKFGLKSRNYHPWQGG